MPFAYSFGDIVNVADDPRDSAVPTGTVVGRAEYDANTNEYLIERDDGEGGTIQEWWNEDQLSSDEINQGGGGVKLPGEGDPGVTAFAYEIGDTIKHNNSANTGRIIGRGEYASMQNDYLVEHDDGTGTIIQSWWDEPNVGPLPEPQ